MSRPHIWSFCDELYKIARDREAIYSPGIAAHEAGHAKVHSSTGRDMAMQYGPMGIGALTNALAGRAPTREAAMRTLVAGGLASQSIRLGDEYASSLIGLKRLKDDKKLSKKELRHEAARLTSAGAGYATMPAHLVTHLMRDPALAKTVRKSLRAGGMVAAVPTFSASGPKVTAREARDLVQAIAPGTDVYSSKKPVSGGAMYVNKSYTPIGKAVVYLTTRAMGMKKEDAKRIARKGGVIVAPVSPLANIGLGLAQQAMAKAFAPYGIASMIGQIPLTLPGSRLRYVGDK